jgi:glycolate oxidase iron-sulfur subunit
MQTKLTPLIQKRPDSAEIDSILRSCVHCGFCNATCPTYNVLGDELDGPRGRIYLLKQLFEGSDITRATQSHLDRCLTCRACETTCPSGVRYGRLLDIGRGIVELNVPRSISAKIVRFFLRTVVPYRRRFKFLFFLVQTLRPLAPRKIKKWIPVVSSHSDRWPASKHQRQVLLLEGCVQPALAPAINLKVATVLDKLAITPLKIKNEGCCGALSHHLAAHQQSTDFIKRNIDQWWPYVEAGIEAIVSTASGCGVMVKDYGDIMQYDAVYAEKARRIAALTCDISELILAEKIPVSNSGQGTSVAFHNPCTLQHGQKVLNAVETILQRQGYQLLETDGAQDCCGSAGVYSFLQRAIAQRLLTDKLFSLEVMKPDVIVTANVGCQMHLQSAARVPVIHWIDLL